MTSSPALFPAVTVTVVKDGKIRTALRTNQIAEFVTVPSWKKINWGYFFYSRTSPCGHPLSYGPPFYSVNPLIRTDICSPLVDMTGLTVFHCYDFRIKRIYNGNWPEWSAIWSEITRVISKSNERAERVWFEITSRISDQNCTTRSSITTLLDPFWNRTI